MSGFSVRAAFKAATLTILSGWLLLATTASAHASNAVGTFMVGHPGGQLHLLEQNKKYGSHTIVSAVCETRKQNNKLYIHAEVKVTNTASAFFHSHGYLECSILASNGREIKRTFIKDTAGPTAIGDNQENTHINPDNGGVIDCTSVDCNDLVVVARMGGKETNDLGGIDIKVLNKQLKEIEKALSQATKAVVSEQFKQYLIALIVA